MTRLVSPELLDLEHHWDPHIFCGPGARVVQVAGRRAPLSDLGAICVEGLRVDLSRTNIGGAGDYNGPLYRQANLGTVRFHLDPELWSAPQIEGPWCVEPGDIVLNKLAPVRASWATSRIARHPADANCVLIKWKRSPTGPVSIPAYQERRVRTVAYWVVVCLNQPAYEEYLLRRSGAAILPRIRLSVLREMAFPAAPIEIEPLAGAVWDWQEAMLETDQELTRLEAEVEDSVGEAIGARATADVPAATDGSWARYFRAEDVGDSLVPNHVAFGSLRRRLGRDSRWNRLGDLLLEPDRSKRARLGHFRDGLRTLRLGDVGRDLFVPRHIEENTAQMAGSAWRVFAEPLNSDEVLFSTLASSPRVAFTDGIAPNNVYVTDHWERLDFRDTPGAWALILNTELIRRQIRLLAMGTFQQFAHPEAIRDLVLPPIDYEVRLRWDDALRGFHKRRAELETRWDNLWTRSVAIFDQVHAAGRDLHHDSSHSSTSEDDL